MSDWLRDLFRRKPTFGEQVMSRADREIEKARQHLEDGLAQLGTQFNERLQKMETIAAMPVRNFTWTPIIDNYGRILALAWKNDPETAQWLLEDPAEGRA
jgi:hypothetical protein